MKKGCISALFCFLLFAISGCAQNGAQGSSQMDYGTTKKMLVDLLKTEEGKKAIKDVLSDESIKQEIVMDQPFIKKTISDELVSAKGQKLWKDLFKDPKFAAAFAKSIKKEHEQLIKDLMKDPEYQQAMMKILNNPKMEQRYLDLIDTQPVRKEMKKIMVDTFDSPLVKAQIMDMLKKAAHDEIDQSVSKKQAGSKSKSQKSQQSSSAQ